MKVFLVLFTLAVSLNSMSQSRKEQIAILKFRIDSLNKEYVKDTTYLSNSIHLVAEKIKRLSKMKSQSKELLARKNETIASKLKTIETLKIQNSQLVKALNDLSAVQDNRLATQSQLELEIGRLLMGQNSNEYYGEEETATEEDYIMEAAAAEAAEAEEENIDEPPPPDVSPPDPPPPVFTEVSTVVEEVVEFPDVEASFPCVEFFRYDSLGTIVGQNQLCGSSAMMKWISKNVNYPQTSIEMNEQGRVFLSFVVEKDGSISNIAIERGVSPDLNREAKRVVRKMPNWIPGEASGRKVRARCRLPINFQLN